MPHNWKNNVLVVTESELVPQFFNTLNALQQNIQRHKYNEHFGIKKVQSGGHGRQLLISYDSLPPEIKNAIPDPRKHKHILDLFYKIDSEAVNFYTNYKYDDGSYLPYALQEAYITNASVLKAVVSLKKAREHERKTKGGSLKGIMATLSNDVNSFKTTLKAKHGIEHTIPASEKRFKEEFKNFLNDGKGFNYACLISKKVKNTNAQKVTDELLELLNAMFAGRGIKPTRTQVAEEYAAFLAGYIEVMKDNDTAEAYDRKNFKEISEGTIISWLGKWSERIGSYSKRSGDRQKEMQLLKPYHSFKRPEHAGVIISVDDRQPPFEYGNGLRPWFYNGIDLGSEAFVCWVYGKSKEGIVLEFYRQLVRNYTEWGFNLPKELEAEASLNSSFTNTFLREGVMFDHVRIEANNARGKRIEAYYRQLRYAVEKGRDGWLARPFAQSEANQAGPQKKVQLPFNEIIQGCLKDIEDWNNMPHTVHQNKTRWEVFFEMQSPATKPTNWMALLPHLGHSQPTSCQVGIIKLQGKEFLLGDGGEVATGEKLINLMTRAEGRDVTAYWLDDNKGNVLKAVIWIGDTPICEAIPKPVPPRAISERSPKDDADYETMCAYVATIEAYRRKKKNGIEDVVIIDNRQKTLNRKFVIPGLNTYTPPPPETETVIMPALPDDDDDFKQISTPLKGLLNRF